MRKQLKVLRCLAACLVMSGFFAAVPANVNAQDKIHYGFDLGFTISFFDKANAPFSDPGLVSDFKKAARPSLEVGGTVEYTVTNTFSLWSGLRYAEKGGAYKAKNPNYVYVSQSSSDRDAYNFLRYRLVYIEMPLFAKLNIYDLFNIQAAESRVNVVGGVSAMYNIRSRLRYNVFEGTNDVEESWEAEKLDAAEKFVLGYTAGAEWCGGPLVFYARYSGSISDVYDVSGPGFESFDVKMSTVSLGMGVTLNY